MTRLRPNRFLLIGIGVLVLMLGIAAPATAQPVLAVKTAASPPGQQRLIKFDTLTPETVESDIAISGLQSGESIRAISFYFGYPEPSLYALGSTSRLYTINTKTGAATPVSSDPFTPALEGTNFGFVAGVQCGGTVVFPCEPALETSDTGQALRIDQLTGAAEERGPLAYREGDPHFGQSPTVVGLSSLGEATFGIDSGLDSLDRVQNEGENEALETVGALGVNTGPDVGFSISQGGNPWAVLDIGGASKLYRIDLGNGAATLSGTLGARITGGIAVPSAQPQLQASPSPLDFGNQPLGTTSPVRTATITLTGGDALGSFTPFVTGANPDDFTVTRDLCVPGLESASEVPLLELPGDNCTVRIRFNPSALGPRSAIFAFWEPKCCPGEAIFEVPLIGTGTSEPTGPVGPQGPQGSQGPQGLKGPPGRDAKVTCKVKGSKKIKCKVVFASVARVSRVRLSRHGITYAAGKPTSAGGKLVLRFSSRRRLKSGRYVLTVIQRVDGRRVVTKSGVTVSSGGERSNG